MASLKRDLGALLDDTYRGNIGMVMENLHPGIDFNAAYDKYVLQENPETSGQKHRLEGQEIYTRSFADWAAEHPRDLGQVAFLANMAADNPLYASILPLKLDNRGYVKRKTIFFNRDLWDVTTRKTGHRYISSRVESIEGHMQFTSQVIAVDLEHLRTPDGPRYLQLALDAMYSNIYAYVHVTVGHAFYASPSFYIKDLNMLYPGESKVPETVEQFMELYELQYGAISKSPQAMQNVINRADEIMQQMGRRVGYILTTQEDMNYIFTMDQTNTWREFGGQQAVRNRQSERTNVRRYGDVSIIDLPFIGTQLHDEITENILRTPVAHGSFWRFLVSYLDVDPAEYRSFMSYVETCSWETNTWDVYKIKDAARWDVHFFPLNSDLRPGLAPNANEGKIDYKWLISVGKKVSRANAYVHRKSGANFANHLHRVDPLLRHVPEARGDQLEFAPIRCFGELSQKSTPSQFFDYVFEVMEARLLGRRECNEPEGRKASVDFISDEEVKHFEEGLELMKELGETMDESPVLMNLEIKDNYFVPNEVGGPEFTLKKLVDPTTKNITAADFGKGLLDENLLDQNLFAGQWLNGLGTIAGFLTVALEISRVRGADGQWKYIKNRGFDPASRSYTRFSIGMKGENLNVDRGAEIAPLKLVKNWSAFYSKSDVDDDATRTNWNTVIADARSSASDSSDWKLVLDTRKAGTDMGKLGIINKAQEYLEERRAYTLRTRARLAKIFDFLAVYEKLIKKLIAIQGEKFMPLAASLIPEYNRHPKMKPLHGAMIGAGNFLLPFRYPVVFNLGEDYEQDLINVRLQSKEAALRLPQPLDKGNEWESAQKAKDFLVTWDANAQLKSFLGYRNQARFFVEIITELKDLQKKALVLDEKLKKAKQKDILIQDANALLKEFYNIASPTGWNITGNALLTGGDITSQFNGLLTILNTLLTKENIEGFTLVVQIFQKIVGTAPMKDSRTGNQTKPYPDAGIDRENNWGPKDLLDFLNIEFPTDSAKSTEKRPTNLRTKKVVADASILNFIIRQLHFDDEAIRDASTENRRKLWRAGIAAVENMTGPIVANKFFIDQERYNSEPSRGTGALFDEQFHNTFAGTLATAGPFINPNIPPTPISGFYSALEWAQESRSMNLPQYEERTQARYATGYPVTEIMKGKSDSEVKLIKDYESKVYRDNSFEHFHTILKDKMKVELPDLFVHHLAYPLSGHPDSRTLSDFDHRWIDSYTKRPTLGFAQRVVLLTEICVQTFDRWDLHDIPSPLLYQVARPWQTQKMKTYTACAAGEAAGNVYFEKYGIENIWSIDPTGKMLYNEGTFGHHVMIDNPLAYFLCEYVQYSEIIGGSGTHFINEGYSRADLPNWNRHVNPILGNGRKMQYKSNLAIMTTFEQAMSTTPVRHYDLRGRFRHADFVTSLPADSISFKPTYGPMYDSMVAINEAFLFSGENVLLTKEDFSYNRTSALKLSNYVCSQTTQRIFSKSEHDKKRILKSYDPWGVRLPGLREKEQGLAPIKIAEHFGGSSIQYLKSTAISI